MSKNYVFNTIPRIYYQRSIQDLSHGHLTTGNVGDLIPFYIQEVYPGDSMKGHGTGRLPYNYTIYQARFRQSLC